MQLITAERELCTGCGICVSICPMTVIEWDANGMPGQSLRAERLCINCGYCVDACPVNALTHRYRKRREDTNAVARRDAIARTKD